MRRILALLGLLATAAPLLAAPRGGDLSKARVPISSEEAQVFARSLVQVATEIHRSYVRPVPLRTLLHAALSGLYEAARQPVPEGLRAEIDKEVMEPGEPQSPVEVLELRAETVNFVAKVRLRLGNRDALAGTNALRIGIEAMARGLDPYCAVVNGEELRRSNGEDLNHGVGLDVLPNGGSGPILVKTVVPGGPAQRKGIQPGDRILHVNGQSVDGQDSAMVLRQINGDPSNASPRSVELTLRRTGQPTPWKVSLKAGYFKPELVLGVRRNHDGSWNYYADPQRKLAHVRLGALEHGAATELQEVLVALQESGMKGLVLDLRWGPGGFLNEAVLASQLFLPGGVVARIKSRGQTDEQVYPPDARKFLGDFPVVVLVNGETFGGSELVAAALQDNNRGVVVGQRTFGKASVQNMMALPIPNAGLKLTSGNFIRPSGKALHRFPDSKTSDDWGIRPEPQHTLPITPDLSRQLREWWLQLSIRPSQSNDALPLDDPEKDPQRQAALKVLAEMVEKRK